MIKLISAYTKNLSKLIGFLFLLKTLPDYSLILFNPDYAYNDKSIKKEIGGAYG